MCLRSLGTGDESSPLDLLQVSKSLESRVRHRGSRRRAGPPTVAQFPAPGETPRPSPRMAPGSRLDGAIVVEAQTQIVRQVWQWRAPQRYRVPTTRRTPRTREFLARRWPVAPLPGRLLQQRQHVAVRRTHGAAHAQFARSVARGVGVSGVRAHFGSLSCGRRSGQLRMQEPAVTGKGAAAPRRRDEHLGGYGRRQRVQGFVVTRARRRAGRVQGQAFRYVVGRESRQENSGRERDRVLDREGAAGKRLGQPLAAGGGVARRPGVNRRGSLAQVPRAASPT